MGRVRGEDWQPPDEAEQDAYLRFIGAMPWGRWAINRQRRRNGKRAFVNSMEIFPGYVDE